MGIHRVRFVWRSRSTVDGRWRLGLFCRYEHRRGFPESGLAISMRGVLSWVAVLMALAYAGSVWLVARSLRDVPARETTWEDAAAWPLHRARIARLRGRAWIVQGRAALAARRYSEAVFFLRRGVASIPDDFEARLTLAQLHLTVGDRVHALALLAEAPAFGLPSAAWRRTVLTIGSGGDDWSFVIDLVDRCLPMVGKDALTERSDLIVAKAQALIGLSRGAEALALLRASDVRTDAVKIQEVRTLLALGRMAEAVDFLAAWRRTAAPQSLTHVIPLQVQAYRQADRMTDFEQALAELKASRPMEADPAAFAVVERARAGHGAAAALDDYLFRFGNTQENVELLAEPLAEIPAVPLLQRLVTAAAEHGFPVRALQMQLAQGLLRQGDWPALARLLIQIEPEFSRRDREPWIWLAWTQRLSLALTSAEAGAHRQIVDFASEQPISLPACKEAITALRRAGRLDTAADLLAAVRRRYGQSPWLGDQDHAISRERAAHLAVAPPPPAPAAAPVELDAFFGALDRAIAASRWQDARDQIDQLRALRPAPLWLAPRDTDLLRRELRIDQALGDVLALRLAAKLLLAGGPERIEELLAFARDCDARGARADAVTIATLVRDAYPLNGPARQLLAAWQPDSREPVK